MSANQDPLKQIGYLQQCLSNNKKPLGIFLGAGCPFAVKTNHGTPQPLIPDIAGITEAVRMRLSNSETCASPLKLLLEHLAAEVQNDCTVEDMLSRIRTLRVVVGKGQVHGLAAANLDALDNEICQIIYELTSQTLPATATSYHRLALWVDAVAREKPVEIFTTNYDLLMEQAFEEYRVPYFDGFAGARKPFFDIRAMEEDVLPARWARLWKLHGSINWYQEEPAGVVRGGVGESGLKRVIHPSHLKYDESRRMPYLAMLDKLRSFMKHPTAALIICGYSFRDDHINEVIMQGLQGSQTTISFALLFDTLENSEKAVRLALQRSNLSLLARDGAVISGRKSTWLEKAPEAIPADPQKWVAWEPTDPATPDGPRSARFLLGDFAVFGEFIHELIGYARQPLEQSDAQ